MLSIDEDGFGLRNTRYGDVYRSVLDPLQEARCVFVEPAWREIERLAAAGREQFHLLELGFGLGVNLSEWMAVWLKRAKPSWRCYFQTIERQPLRSVEYRQAWATIQRSTSGCPAVSWLERFEPDGVYALPGLHRYGLQPDFCFDFFVADASLALKRLNSTFDIVFLNASSESLNPTMWRAELLRHLRRHLFEGALLLSGASSEPFQERLSALEFEALRLPGFPPNRFRLEARYKPYRRVQAFSRGTAPLDLLIIGAGLAGQCMAQAASARGLQGILIDPKAQQDGDPEAQLPVFLEHLHCSPDDNEIARLCRASLLSAYRIASERGSPGLLTAATGRLQPLPDQTLRHAWQTRLQALGRGSEGSFDPWPSLFRWLDEALLFLPRSRALSLPAALPFRQAKARVAYVERDAHDGRWKSFDDEGCLIGSASALVLTSPQALMALGLNHAMALQKKPGVSLIIDIRAMPPAHQIWELKAIRAGQQQVVRLSDPDRLLVGALYGEPTDDEARASLMAAAQQLLSCHEDDFALLAKAPSRLWRGVRYSAPDHLPMIGAIADGDRMGQQWDRLKTNARLPIPRLEQAYALTALGARGALWAPFGAEVLLDMMQSIPCPLESDLLAAIDPARAMIRAMRRGSIGQAQCKISSRWVFNGNSAPV